MSVWECDFWVDVHLARIYMLLEIICLYLKVCRDLEEGVLLKPPGDRCCSLHRLSSLKSSLLFFIRPSFFLPAFAFVVLLAVTSRWVEYILEALSHLDYGHISVLLSLPSIVYNNKFPVYVPRDAEFRLIIQTCLLHWDFPSASHDMIWHAMKYVYKLLYL